MYSTQHLMLLRHLFLGDILVSTIIMIMNVMILTQVSTNTVLKHKFYLNKYHSKHKSFISANIILTNNYFLKQRIDKDFCPANNYWSFNYHFFKQSVACPAKSSSVMIAKNISVMNAKTKVLWMQKIVVMNA